MRWRRRATPGPGSDDLTVFVDESSSIDGHCTFAGTALVNGRITGEITSTGTLIVGDRGVVHATIQGATVLVSGEVAGDVVASQRLELRKGARVFGDLEAPVLVIEDGALFEGRCRMTRPAAAETAAPAGRDASVVPLKRS